jgi:hypothetical protein
MTSMAMSMASTKKNDAAAISASANTSEAAAAYATSPLAGSKRPASTLDDSPSPIRPDYNVAKSSGDSVASGDDSGQWEVEGERILAAHIQKNEEEAAMVDNLANDIEEIEEFMLDGEDLNKVAMEGNEAPPLVHYKNVVFPFKTTTANTLKELVKEIGVQYTGAKKIL